MKNNILSIIVLLISLLVFNACEEDKEIQVFNIPLYKNLYLVGDATPAGWDIGNPSPMTVNPENGFEFTWEGTLTLGQFKIPVSVGDWGTDYFMPVVDGETDLTKTTMELVKGGNPDKKWVINQPGKYKITVNVEDLDNPTINFELVEALPDYPTIYLIGSATSVGWDIGNALAMTVDESSAFIHTWTGELGEGELKLMTARNWGVDQFGPVNGGEEDLTKTTCQLAKGGNPDNKWNITATTKGSYKIVLNITDAENPTVSFSKQ